METNGLKEAIKKLALDLSFDDIRFTENPLGGEKKTAAFLIKRYIPSDGQAGEGEIALSEYYPASQFGYENALVFIALLKSELGLAAEATNAMNYKKLMLTTGGTIGKNSLYYHPEFGSFISMRCVLIGAEVLPDRESETKNLCADCRRCAAACPTGAIDGGGWTREKCLRNMMSEGIPESERKKVYELLGCELCQLVCPMNPEKRKAPETYSLLEILRENETKHLKAKCGKNMATRTKLLTQGMAYAAAKGYRAVLSEIETLTDDSTEKVREMAVWAKKDFRR